jgi:triacylglycerol lipase
MAASHKTMIGPSDCNQPVATGTFARDVKCFGGSLLDNDMKENNSLEALMNPGEAEDFFDIASLAEFESGTTTVYGRTNALWLAEFSRLIYRRESDEIKARPAGFRTRDQFLSPRGWRQLPNDFFNTSGTQAALFVNADLKCAALVFRGTLGLADIITDAKFVLVDWLEKAGQVHVGFRDALQNVWSQIEARLAGFPYPVFYTGHSLGAALATLAVARTVIEDKLPRPAGLYTFGSPRVGDAAFTSTLRNVYHCRVVNDSDIVATVPTPPFFRHDGELHHIRHDGRIEVHARDADVLMTLQPGLLIERTAAALNGLVAGLRAFGLGLPEQLTDHSPVNYTAHLEEAG